MRLPGIQYDSPLQFTRKQRLILAIVPPLIARIYKLLGATCLRRLVRPDIFEDMLEARGTALLALWHESTGILACYFVGRNFHSTASYSFDGELAARAVHCFGAETVRGSSSRGGSLALDQMEKVLGKVPAVGLTLDGPRGPRRVAKAGIAILAARTQTPIVPVAAALDRAWRMRSWDRFMVPKPFARVVYAFAEPIAPPADDTPEAVEAVRLQVEQSLNALHDEIERAFGGRPE